MSGYDEVVAVLNNTETFSNCNTVVGPFARWPVPHEGDDISDIIEQYRDELPFSDQLPSFDPPKHTAHRALLLRLITPKRLRENEDCMWRLADRQLEEFLGQRVPHTAVARARRVRSQQGRARQARRSVARRASDRRLHEAGRRRLRGR